MHDHSFDNLPPEWQRRLEPIEWTKQTSKIKMGCGHEVVIYPGDTLWVYRPGEFEGEPDIRIAISRKTIQ